MTSDNVPGLKRGHQNRLPPAADLGRFVVTLSAASVVQGGSVTVTAQYSSSGGLPVATAGLVITWSKAGSAGGVFSAATSTTDSAGIATVTFTPGSTIGASYTITATAAGPITGTSTAVTVTGDTTPASITLSPTSLILAEGQTAPIIATVKNALGVTLLGVLPSAWQSTVEADATVSSTGLVTYVSEGATVITATLNGITSNSVAVTLQPAYSGGTIHPLIQQLLDGVWLHGQVTFYSGTKPASSALPATTDHETVARYLADLTLGLPTLANLLSETSITIPVTGGYIYPAGTVVWTRTRTVNDDIRIDGTVAASGSPNFTVNTTTWTEAGTIAAASNLITATVVSSALVFSGTITAAS